MFCEFCGSGPTCGVCGRGEAHWGGTEQRMGCTVATVREANRSVRVVVRGYFATLVEVADAIATGTQFKAKYLAN